MSKVASILSACKTALSGSTSITTVKDNTENIWDLEEHLFPVVIVRAENRDVSRLSFDSTGLADRVGELRLKVIGMVHDRSGIHSTILAKRDALETVIENVLVMSTGVKATLFDIWPEKSDYDSQIVDNYGIVDIDFRVKYFYNKATP